MVKRSNLIDVMHIFKDICGLLWAHGAMDDMQIHVEKLKAWVFQSNHIFFQIKRL
jgi:replication fork clamp-binding protein CrfC